MATARTPMGGKPLTNIKTPDADRKKDTRKVVALKLTPAEIKVLDEWRSHQDLPFGSTKDVITFLYKTALRHNVQAVGLMVADNETALPAQLDIES